MTLTDPTVDTVDEPDDTPAVLEELTEEEAYLYAILTDASGIDQAELLWADETKEDGAFRVHPYQWSWWRAEHERSIDQCGRSVGKSLRIEARTLAFPFIFPGNEHVITAPEATHLDSLTERIEARMKMSWFYLEMLQSGRSGITHRPFRIAWKNGTRTQTKVPQRSGVGLKGAHPVWLDVDECLRAGTLVLTRDGHVPIEDIKVGDMVVTHRRRWRPVIGVAQRQRPTVEISGMGHPGLGASVNHPFLAAKRLDGYERKDNRLAHKTNLVGAPQWLPAHDLAGGYWATPARYPQHKWVPSFRGPGHPYGPQAVVPCEQDNDQFMWIVGLYIAEGSTSSSSPALHDSKATWSIHTDEVPEVVERMESLGLKPWVDAVQNSENCKNVNVASVHLARWLKRQCGTGAANKRIPTWCLGVQRSFRQSLLDGLVYGDGYYRADAKQREWKLSTASRELAIGARMLAATVDQHASVYWNDLSDRVTMIRGREVRSDGFYQVVGGRETGRGFTYDHALFDPVHTVTPTNRVEDLYDLEVDDDHSFIADGIIVHNSQDMPERAWKEMPETVRWEVPGARWCCHGVSKGLRDDFFKKTQPGSGWVVHQISRMQTPDWTPKLKAQQLQEYGGSEESPDYKRNILGEHGDAQNVIFVRHNFMAGVDDREEESDYLRTEYFKATITGEMIAARVGSKSAVEASSEAAIAAMLEMVDFPKNHDRYETFWAGMDIGLVSDPSELLVFAEYVPKAKERAEHKRVEIVVPDDGVSRFKLLTRLQLFRLPEPLQVELLMHVIQTYRPRALALDGTGIGLPMFQLLQQKAGTSRILTFEPPEDATEDEKVAFANKRDNAKHALTVIKNYNFSAKVLIDVDEEKAAELPPGTPITEVLEKAGLRQVAKDRGTDVLRTLVDHKRMLWPMDAEVVNQMNGQTYRYSSEPQDAYGKRRMIYSNSGPIHILDAARMFALGWSQERMEELIAAGEPERQPVFPIFFN